MRNKYIVVGKAFDLGNCVLAQTLRQRAILFNVTNHKYDPSLKVFEGF